MLKGTYNTYAYLDSLDRWRFTLAEYHAGHGHVTDARRLAIEMGRDPNRWDGSLNVTLPRLMDQKYFSKTRHGFYGGEKTVEYVEEIINRFRIYTRLVARHPEPRIDQSPGNPARTPSATSARCRTWRASRPQITSLSEQIRLR